MSQRVDLSSYYTRKQADSRYLHVPPVPQPPTLAVAGSGLVSSDTDVYAYVDLLITDPTPPPGTPAIDPYIQGYLVQISYPAAGGTRTKSQMVPHIPAGDDAYRLSSLPCGVEITFQLWSVDFAGQHSATPATGTFATPPDNIPPTAPSIVVEIQADGPNVVLTRVNTESDFNYYSLQRRTDTGIFAEVAEFTGGDYVDTNIPVTGYYYYQVQAYDLSGNYSTSNEVGPVLLQQSIPVPPAALDLSQATAVANADGSIAITFSASTDPKVTSYRVWRQTVNGDPFSILLDSFDSPGTPTIAYTDTQTTDGLTYLYNVTCINTDDLESARAAISIQATSDRTIAPIAPTGIGFSGGLGLLNVTWTGDPAAAVYGVSWRFAQQGDPGLTTFGEEMQVQTTSLDLRGLIMPTTGMPPTKDDLANEFEVRIRTGDGKNWSAYTNQIVTYPELTGYQPADVTLPAAPATLAILTPPDGSTQLSWTAPNLTDLWGYQVEQWDSISAEWTTIAPVKDILSGGKTFGITGLEPYGLQQRSYRFRVRTLDNTGNLSQINLLENPSFDGDTSNWASAAGAGAVMQEITDSTLARNQTGECLQANWAAQPSQRASILDPAPYTASAFVRTDTVQGTASLQLSILDIFGRVLNNGTASLLTGGAYQRLTVTVDASPGAAFAVVVLLGSTDNHTQTFLWDDVQLEQLPFASPYGYGVSPIFQASTTGSGPADYPTLNFHAIAQLGSISLYWNNPTTSFLPAPGINNGYKDYINGTFQLFRASYASGATEGAVPSVEVQASDSSLWAIEVDEQGDLDTLRLAGTPMSFAMQDATGATAWHITVATDGAVNTTPVAVSNQPSSCLLVTPLGSYWVLAVTTAGEVLVVASYIKIAEILASVGDNARFDDLQADEMTASTYYYKLRAVDRFGNIGQFLNGGNPISATTLTIYDKGIADANSVSTAQTAANSALSKIGAVTDVNGNLLLKNITQVSDDTTSTTDATQGQKMVTGMSETLTTHGSNVLMVFNALLTIAGGASATVSFRCDGVEFYKMANLTGPSYLISMPWLDIGRSASQHTYQVWWYLASGSSSQTAQMVSKSMQVIELG